MVNSYTPTYYSTLQDSITSMCKNILPFSFKKKRLPAIAAAEQKLSKHQSDNLKWQQESYHQILNLMGLCKEGILQENEVSAFRSHLLDTLIASPLDYEHVVILKDKLVFLQELFYAQIITEEEYHSSKRPLLQRLAVQGAEIEARDLVVGETKAKSDEEWAAIDLKDDKCFISKENVNSKAKTKHGSTIKEAATSVFGFGSSAKTGKLKEEKGVCGLGKQQEFGPFSSGKNEVGVSQENFWNCSVRDSENETKSILMASETLPQQTSDKQSGGEKMKKNNKQWGFEGLKRWKKSDTENETAPLSLVEKSDGETYLGKLVEIPLGGGPDTVQMKKKLNSDGSSSGFFVDKVLGDKIRKELTRIQMEIRTKNPNAQFTNEQIEAISTRLPVDKVDLKKFFPKTWCDRYGELVLDVVRNEFKEHVGEMKGQQQQQQQTFAKDNNYNTVSTKKWATFDDDDENCHPNLFAPPPRQPYSVAMKQANFVPANADRLAYGSSRAGITKRDDILDQ